MIGVIEKAIEVAEKAAETSSEIKEAAKSKDISAVSKFENASMQFKEGLSDEALKARVEAAAHSANKFFGIPDIDVLEGDAIGVYRGCDILLDKDVFEYSLDQFKDMKCLSFEDMTKVWSHECGHRIFRDRFTEFKESWTQELGADFFSGVRSEMLGLPTSNFEKLLASTTGSVTHPVGSLRIQAIQFGRDVVRGFQEKGITPTIENCKEAFANSPFAKITYENYETPQYAAFVNGEGKPKIKANQTIENQIEKSNSLKNEGKDINAPVTQYIDSETLETWRKDPENANKLKLGREHSSTVLRDNMKAVTGENPENSEAHHVVGNDTPIAAKKMEEFNIDRNDPANGIFLPNSAESKLKGSIHDGRHSTEYINEVERRAQLATSREEFLEVLDSIKEDLYNGDLNVNKDNRFNK